MFSALKLSPTPGFAVHSLDLPNHAYKLVGEADFVVVSPHGVLVLEVKGGGISFSEVSGCFVTTDRNGCQHELAENPFQQAYSAMFAIRDIVRQRLGDDVVDKVSFGAAVAFPETEWRKAFREPGAPPPPPDLPDEALIDRDDFAGHDDPGRALARAQAFWRAKKPHTQDLTPARIAEVRRALRPAFELAPCLGWRIERLESSFVAFTEDQCEKLDVLEDNSHVIIIGGAGTGKTFLALETAKRHARSGEQVALVVSSPVMRAFLEVQLQGEAVPVLTLEGIREGAVGAEDTYDVLVVDEAQDAMNLEDLDQLESRLRGGFGGGTWRFFLDPNNQAGLVGSFEDEVYEWVLSMATLMRLKDNCRNTEEIVRQTQTYTGADLGVSGAGKGFPVEWASAETPEEEATALQEWTDALVARGVHRHEFAFISPLPLAASAVSLLPRRWTADIAVLDKSQPCRQPDKAVFASPGDFKGLEATYVALVDYSEDDIRAVAPLYVGMTRARALLWVNATSAARTVLSEIAARVLELT